MPDDHSLCVRRGSRWLAREDHEAHVATLLRLENIGVFLGAGASTGNLSGRTSRDTWRSFEEKASGAAAWLESNNFYDSQQSPNIEAILDLLELELIIAERARESKAERIKESLVSLQREVMRAALLKPDWWEAPSEINLEAAELDQHRRLLLKLTTSRTPGQPAPWIFTTNYDLAIEWAAETIGLNVVNGFTGLHHRRFSPHNFDLGFRNVLARGEARFGTYNIYLAKLHGSLSWVLASPHHELREEPVAALWPRLKAFLDEEAQEGPGLIVYPSGSKHLHTASFELGELVRRFAEFVARPQSGLIVSGYSFSDEHLNRILASGLQNPTFHLVIYFPEASRLGNRLQFGEGSSHWLQQLARSELPQVTIVGGGECAYFGSLVQHIPDPVIFDEHALEVRRIVQEMRGWNNSAATVSTEDGTSEDPDEDIPF